jgi:hypothetical protein
MEYFTVQVAMAEAAALEELEATEVTAERAAVAEADMAAVEEAVEAEAVAGASAVAEAEEA